MPSICFFLRYHKNFKNTPKFQTKFGWIWLIIEFSKKFISKFHLIFSFKFQFQIVLTSQIWKQVDNRPINRYKNNTAFRYFGFWNTFMCIQLILVLFSNGLDFVKNNAVDNYKPPKCLWSYHIHVVNTSWPKWSRRPKFTFLSYFDVKNSIKSSQKCRKT